MTYIWIKEDDDDFWVPHMEFDEKNDPNRGTTILTDAQAEIADLRDQGIKVKRGGAF
tara:strand:- start:1687 stop:1857 length:171 start_codon:yes stop_codon:yes gene_type:complete